MVWVLVLALNDNLNKKIWMNLILNQRSGSAGRNKRTDAYAVSMFNGDTDLDFSCGWIKTDWIKFLDEKFTLEKIYFY